MFFYIMWHVIYHLLSDWQNLSKLISLSYHFKEIIYLKKKKNFSLPLCNNTTLMLHINKLNGLGRLTIPLDGRPLGKLEISWTRWTWTTHGHVWRQLWIFGQEIQMWLCLRSPRPKQISQRPHRAIIKLTEQLSFINLNLVKTTNCPG